MTDARIEAYFWGTTLAMVAELHGQDFDRFLIGALLWRGLTAYWIYHQHQTQEGNRKNVGRSHIALAISFASSAAYWMNESPTIWDSTLWTIPLDIVMTVWLLSTQCPLDDAQVPCETCAEIFCFYYTASGFFKLNAQFLDPDVSCATVFCAQHIAYYLAMGGCSFDTIVSVLAVCKPYAPLVVVFVELAMGVCISAGRLWHSRRWTFIGLLFILYFHLAVCCTPRPNDISMFAVKCGARLVVFLDPMDVRQVLDRVKSPTVLPYLTAAATLLVAGGMQHNFSTPNWGFLVYTALLIFLQYTLLLSPTVKQPRAAVSKHVFVRPLWTRVAVAVAAFYSFGSIILGLQELATPNMYGNLKTHGGSNHLLVPTGLLFAMFRDNNAHPFGGGVIRIEQTDSSWFKTTYPADLTHVLQPVATLVPLLTAVGSRPPIFFNASANRILRLFERGWVQHSGKLIQYTVPAIEFKRLFSEALLRDKTFDLVYAQLPGSVGDELWRATAVERRVSVTVKNGEITACEAIHYHGTGQTTTAACAEWDLPFQLRVPWLIRKIAMFHGYPIIFEEDGSPREHVMCFGT